MVLQRQHSCGLEGFCRADYRELDTPEGPFILPSSTPVQFDPAAMRESIFRMLGLGPMSVYLTHYGALQGVPRLGNLLLAQIDRMVEAANQVALRGLSGPNRHAALIDALGNIYASELAAIGSTLSDQEIRDHLSIDIELNAQGLGVWLDQQSRS